MMMMEGLLLAEVDTLGGKKLTFAPFRQIGV